MQEARVWLDRSSPMIDLLLAFVLFGAILFVQILGPLTPLIVAAFIPAFCLLRWERLPAVLTRCWSVLLLPGFALASALWSDAPGTTIRYGFLYLITIMPALFLGAGADRLAVLKGMFAVFALYAFASFVFGRYVPWGTTGVAFAGLGGSKNLAGDVAGLTVLLSAAIGTWAMGQRRLVWLGAAAVTGLLAIYLLFASKATGALVATAMALPCLLLWAGSRRLPLPVRTTIFTLTVLTAVVLAATASSWMPYLFDMVLANSGKDAGLTGRDFLWRGADTLIAERPWLGGGYRHFWVETNLDAQYIWRRMMISTHYGFNFHNTPRDILVDLGYVGLALFTVVTLYGAIGTLVKTMVAPAYLGIFLCALIVFEAPRLFFELVAFHDMHYSTVLIFMILGYALRPKTLAAIRSG